jgi:hypothetical protein
MLASAMSVDMHPSSPRAGGGHQPLPRGADAHGGSCSRLTWPHTAPDDLLDQPGGCLVLAPVLRHQGGIVMGGSGVLEDRFGFDLVDDPALGQGQEQRFADGQRRQAGDARLVFHLVSSPSDGWSASRRYGHGPPRMLFVAPDGLLRALTHDRAKTDFKKNVIF